MKKIFSTALFLLCITLPTNLFSQTIEQDTTSIKYHLSNEDSAQDIKDAYTQLEPQLLADIKWLNDTPIKTEEKQIRDEKARFVLMWMSGSPTVSIQMDDRLITFLGADPAILMAYMMGWTQYAIENNYSDDTIQCSVAGITNAVSFYSKNKKNFKENKELEKYKNMIDGGTLTRHVADILTK